MQRPWRESGKILVALIVLFIGVNILIGPFREDLPASLLHPQSDAAEQIGDGVITDFVHTNWLIGASARVDIQVGEKVYKTITYTRYLNCLPVSRSVHSYEQPLKTQHAPMQVP